MSVSEMKKYIGKTAHVIVGGLDRWGTVTRITDDKKFKGTWGPETVDPKHDYISFSD